MFRNRRPRSGGVNNNRLREVAIEGSNNYTAARTTRLPGKHVHDFLNNSHEANELRENLSMRYEALESGKLDLLENVKKLQEATKKEELQIENITKEQENIRKTIIDMESRIQLLEEHKKQYHNKIDKWREKQAQELTKVQLLETTLNELKGQLK